MPTRQYDIPILGFIVANPAVESLLVFLELFAQFLNLLGLAIQSLSLSLKSSNYLLVLELAGREFVELDLLPLLQTAQVLFRLTGCRLTSCDLTR